MIRALGTALKSIRRSPYQALVAVMMMTLSFFVAYTFVFVLFVANKALEYIETRPQVIAYFEVKAPSEQISAAQAQMETKSYVADVKVISKQEALRIFQEENKKDPLLAELVSADILPASLEVSARSVQHLAQISKDLEAMEGVEEVIYQKDVIENLSRWARLIRQSGLFITCVLFLITFLLVFVILSLRVVAKRKEIGIMNLLGASRWYIRGPYIYEGIIYGLSGAILGGIGSLIVMLYATPAIVAFFGSIQVLPIPPDVIAAIFGSGLIVGICLGLFSSSLAVTRFIKH